MNPNENLRATIEARVGEILDRMSEDQVTAKEAALWASAAKSLSSACAELAGQGGTDAPYRGALAQLFEQVGIQRGRLEPPVSPTASPETNETENGI